MITLYKSYQNTTIMKTAELLHNPKAGEEEHSEKQLVKSIKAAGFKCRYLSTKTDEWKNTNKDTEFFIVAGGDGTIRKVAKSIYCNETPDLPVAILPMGTANNIAQTMGLTQAPEKIMESWHDARIKQVDTGTVSGHEKPVFFLEGFGYGVFPRLMHTMKNYDKASMSTDERLQKALEELYSIVLATPALEYTITMDNKDYSGKYIMAEVMNIRSIGPNLVMAPDADPGDGYFDVVLVAEQQRGLLAGYIAALKDGAEHPEFPLHAITAQHITIHAQELYLHADDKLIQPEEAVTMTIAPGEKQLRFLVTQ